MKKRKIITNWNKNLKEIHDLEKMGMRLYDIDAHLKAKKRREREKFKNTLSVGHQRSGNVLDWGLLGSGQNPG